MYCLEMGWHPSFNIATVNCRMSIEEDENRGLFVALFRHIQVGLGVFWYNCHTKMEEDAVLLFRGMLLAQAQAGCCKLPELMASHACPCMWG